LCAAFPGSLQLTPWCPEPIAPPVSSCLPKSHSNNSAAAPCASSRWRSPEALDSDFSDSPIPPLFHHLCLRRHWQHWLGLPGVWRRWVTLRSRTGSILAIVDATSPLRPQPGYKFCPGQQLSGSHGPMWAAEWCVLLLLPSPTRLPLHQDCLRSHAMKTTTCSGPASEPPPCKFHCRFSASQPCRTGDEPPKVKNQNVASYK
jgi:hypothetical protein